MQAQKADGSSIMKKRVRTLIKQIWKHRTIYLLLLPAIIWFLIFCYYPMFGLQMAFRDFKYSKGITGSPWVGLQWFERFMIDLSFWEAVVNTLRISLLKLVFTFPAPVILALMINAIRVNWFKRTIQTISYMPHFVSWVVVAAMINKLFGPYDGMLNQLRTMLDPTAKSIHFLARHDLFYWFIVLSSIWKGIGWGTIIYLAALSGIDPQMYEAAAIDGARPMQMMRHITLPSLYPTICILFIMELGSVLSVGYEQLLLLSTTQTQHMAEVIDTYVIRKGLTNGSISYATAIGLCKSVITLVLVVTANAISRKVSEVSLW